MDNEYVIINKTELLKVMEELETKRLKNPYSAYYTQPLDVEINTLKQVLSKGVPLIPVVEKAFNAGYIRGYDVGHGDAKSHPLALTIAKHIHKDRQEYISNLNI